MLKKVPYSTYKTYDNSNKGGLRRSSCIINENF